MKHYFLQAMKKDLFRDLTEMVFVKSYLRNC
nr:MAG TPA: hypothetical protein [Caudoviricetes sp.]